MSFYVQTATEVENSVAHIRRSNESSSLHV